MSGCVSHPYCNTPVCECMTVVSVWQYRPLLGMVRSLAVQMYVCMWLQTPMSFHGSKISGIRIVLLGCRCRGLMTTLHPNSCIDTTCCCDTKWSWKHAWCCRHLTSRRGMLPENSRALFSSPRRSSPGFSSCFKTFGCCHVDLSLASSQPASQPSQMQSRAPKKEKYVLSKLPRRMVELFQNKLTNSRTTKKQKPTT